MTTSLPSPAVTVDDWQKALRNDRIDQVQPWLNTDARMARVEFPSGQTLLGIAAEYGATACVAALIPHSDLHHDDGNGWTPMMHALNRRSNDVAVALLTAGGSSTFDVVDDGGRTALHLAAEKGMVGVVNTWMDLVPVAQVQHHLQAVDSEGKTPWCEAAAQGQMALLQALVNRAGSVGLDQPDEEGWTPLLYAVIQRHLEVATFLAPLSPVAHANDQGNTAISLAEGYNDQALVAVLKAEAHRQEVAALRDVADQAMDPSADHPRVRL